MINDVTGTKYHMNSIDLVVNSVQLAPEFAEGSLLYACTHTNKLNFVPVVSFSIHAI